jgi:Ca2+-binding EF-hand superfamily protein
LALQTYSADKQKWTHLDKNGDQALSYDEFRKFLRPEDDDDLRKLEINSIIKEYDDNNDGKISADEYLKMTGTSNDRNTSSFLFCCCRS